MARSLHLVGVDLHLPVAERTGTAGVALVMLGILGQLPDFDEPGALVRQYLDALPAGSYLAVCDGTDVSPALKQAIAAYNQNSASSYHLRAPALIGAFFDGLTLAEPGVVPSSRWRPGSDEAPGGTAGPDATACGVGLKQLGRPPRAPVVAARGGAARGRPGARPPAVLP